MAKVQVNQTKNTVQKVVTVEETVNEINITLTVKEAAYLALLTGATNGTRTEFNFASLFNQLANALGIKGSMLSKKYNSIRIEEHFPNIGLDDIKMDKSLLNSQGAQSV